MSHVVARVFLTKCIQLYLRVTIYELFLFFNFKHSHCSSETLLLGESKTNNVSQKSQQIEYFHIKNVDVITQDQKPNNNNNNWTIEIFNSL